MLPRLLQRLKIEWNIFKCIFSPPSIFLFVLPRNTSTRRQPRQHSRQRHHVIGYWLLVIGTQSVRLVCNCARNYFRWSRRIFGGWTIVLTNLFAAYIYPHLLWAKVTRSQIERAF